MPTRSRTETKTTESPFLFLALDLPPPPLFQDSVEKNIIPQVTLASVLAKYDGKTTKVKEHSVPHRLPLMQHGLGIRWPIETLLVHEVATIHRRTLQTFHQK